MVNRIDPIACRAAKRACFFGRSMGEDFFNNVSILHVTLVKTIPIISRYARIKRESNRLQLFPQHLSDTTQQPVLLNFRVFAARDDFFQPIPYLCLWGRRLTTRLTTCPTWSDDLRRSRAMLRAIWWLSWLSPHLC